jgi:hypothetical protein
LFDRRRILYRSLGENQAFFLFPRSAATTRTNKTQKTNNNTKQIMLRLSRRNFRWIGGAAVNQPILGTNMAADHKTIIGIEKAVVSNDWSVDPSALSGNFQPWSCAPTSTTSC